MHKYRYSFAFLGIVGAMSAGPVLAQEARSQALSALDSLLNIPVNAAARHAQDRSEAAASVTVVTAEEIRRYGYRTLAHVLRNVRGFYTSDDLSYSYVGARGLGLPTEYNNRFLLLVDGLRWNEGVFGGALVGSELGIDLDAVDRIEIIRGPASAVHGTGAMFGVINVITKKGNAIDGLQVRGEAGSVGMRGASVAFGRSSPGLDLAINAHAFGSDGQDFYVSAFDDPGNNNGLAEDLGWRERFGVMATARWGGVLSQLSFSSHEGGIPAAPYGSLFNNDNASQRDRYGVARLEYALVESPSLKLTLEGHGMLMEHTGTYPFALASFGAGSGDVLIYDRTRSFRLGSSALAKWDLSPRHRFIAGLEANWIPEAESRNWTATMEIGGVSASYHILSGFAQGEFQLTDELAVSAGVRHDSREDVPATTSPRFALVAHPWQATTFKLLYGEAFRTPSVAELDFDTPAAGFVSNPFLVPEKIRTQEIVWEQRLSGALQFSTSYFHYHVRDLIDYVEVAIPLSLQGQIPELYRWENRGTVGAGGFEAELTAVLGSGIMGYGSYTYQTTHDHDTDSGLSNSPRHLWKAGGSAPIGPVTLGTNVVYESSRRTLEGTYTDGYVLADLTVLAQADARLSVSLSVKNLFDTAYELPAGIEHMPSALPQRGRHGLIVLRYGF